MTHGYLTLDCYLASPEVLKCNAFDMATRIPGQSKFYLKNGVPPGRVFRGQNSGIFLSRRDICHVCIITMIITAFHPVWGWYRDVSPDQLQYRGGDAGSQSHIMGIVITLLH